jgi:GAF domain-containing protein
LVPARSAAQGADSDGTISIDDLRLDFFGPLRAGWEQEAKLFGAQAAALIRAHRAIELNRRHESEISSLYAALAQLTARRDLGAVLATVVDRARHLLGSDLAYIMLLDESGRSLRIRVASGNRTQAFMQVERPVRPGVSAYSGRPVRTADFLNDPELDHHPATDALVRLEGLRSVLAVPLRTDLAELGTLCVANRLAKEFTEHELSLLNSLAEHAALALDNARLYEDAVNAAASSAAARAEAETHLRRLQRLDSVHRKLTEVILAGHGVPAVAATLAESFTAGIAVTDWRQRVIADVESGLVDRQGEIITSVRRRRDVAQALERCAARFETAKVASDLLIAPIAARRELLGYIWAHHRAQMDSNDELRTSLEQAARVVALEMLREREAVEIERRLRRDFMYELLSEDLGDRRLLESRARQMWRGYVAEHRPLVISVVSRDAVGASPLERARRLLSESRPSDFVTIHGSCLVLLTNSVDRLQVTAHAEALRRLLVQNGISTSVAIGAVCRSIGETRSVTLTIKRLLELLPQAGILWTEGLEALTVLFEPSRADQVEAFVRKTLRPFGGNEVQMSTLLAYYEAGCNRTEAARRLQTHVNTMRTRLERIEVIVGGSVDESPRAIPLRLALLMRGLFPLN